MHLILFVLRLIFGRDFLRSGPHVQIAVRPDGRMQCTTEAEAVDMQADELQRNLHDGIASWLMFCFSSWQRPGRAADRKGGPARPPAPPRRQ